MHFSLGHSSHGGLTAWVLLIVWLVSRTAIAIPVTTNSTDSTSLNTTTASFNTTLAYPMTNHTFPTNITSLSRTNTTSFAGTVHYRGPGPKIPQGGDPSIVPPWNSPPKIPLHFNGARWACKDARYFGAVCAAFAEAQGSWYWGICNWVGMMPWEDEVECQPCQPDQYMLRWCGFAECAPNNYGGPSRGICGHVAPHNVDDPVVDNKPDYGGLWLPGIEDYWP